MKNAAQRPDNYILYDGQCPVCSRFVEMARLRKAVPGIEVLDARDQPELVEDFRSSGLDLNDGMLIHIDGKTYYGDDAFIMINSLGDGKTLLSRFMFRVLSSPTLSRRMYPTLVIARKLLLNILSRKEL